MDNYREDKKPNDFDPWPFLKPAGSYFIDRPSMTVGVKDETGWMVYDASFVGKDYISRHLPKILASEPICHIDRLPVEMAHPFNPPRKN